MLKQQNKPRFPEHLRLFIFSFVDTKTCITHISQLSKKENVNLMNSYLVREGRSYELCLKNLQLFGAYKIEKTLDLRNGVFYKHSRGREISKLNQL